MCMVFSWYQPFLGDMSDLGGFWDPKFCKFRPPKIPELHISQIPGFFVFSGIAHFVHFVQIFIIYDISVKSMILTTVTGLYMDGIFMFLWKWMVKHSHRFFPTEISPRKFPKTLPPKNTFIKMPPPVVFGVFGSPKFPEFLNSWFSHILIFDDS